MAESRETQLARLIDDVAPLDATPEEPYWSRLDSLTKPPRSLGRLERLAVDVARIQRTDRPDVTSRRLILAAGDHGVVAEGVSCYPQEVTAQMVANFASGGAAITQIAAANRVELTIADFGVASEVSGWAGVLDVRVAPGTANMTEGPAMTRDQCAVAVSAGATLAHEAVHAGAALLGVGEMGIGNSTSAAALTAAITGVEPDTVVGRGTGLDDAGMKHKADVVSRSLETNEVDPDDALGVLSAVGGFEIAGLTGVILGAAAERVPVVLDGFISTSAALIASRMCPHCRGYMVASHRSTEPGHRVLLEALELDPLLDLEMHLGEGTGAALGMGIMDAACRVMSGMATFEQAGVSENLDGGDPL